MKRLAILLFLFILTLALVGCRSTNESYVGSRDAVEITRDELAAYTVVRPLRLSDAESDEMTRLMQTVKQRTGVQLYPADDLRGIESLTGPMFFFGKVNHPLRESTFGEQAFDVADFAIAYVDGTVMLTGESHRALGYAVDFLFDKCYDAESGSFWIPLYHFEAVGRTSPITVDGRAIAPEVYAVAYESDGDRSVAETLASALSLLTGKEFTVSNDDSYRHLTLGKRMDTEDPAPYLLEMDDSGSLYLSAADGYRLTDAVSVFLYKTFGYNGVTRDGASNTASILLASGSLSFTDADYDTLLKEWENLTMKHTVYVDTNRKTSGNGTKDAPYASLSEAFAAAEAMIASSASPIDVTVSLADGTHTLTETAVFSGAALTEKHYSVRLTGDNATLSSAIRIDNASLTAVDGKKYYSFTLPEAYRNADGTWPALRDLSVNGEMLTMARTEGERLFDRDAVKFKDEEKTVPVDPEDRILYLESDLFTGMASEDIKDAELWIKVEWEIYCVHIDYIDRTRTDRDGALVAVKIRDKDWESFLGDPSMAHANYYSMLGSRGYWIQNHEKYLTKRNTFVYDRDTGSFSVIFDTNVDPLTADIRVPMLGNLVSFFDARNVTVDHLTFTGTTNPYIADNGYIAGQCGFQKGTTAYMNPYVKDADYRKNLYGATGVGSPGFLTYAAVYGANLSGLTVRDCIFEKLGADALSVRGAIDDVTVTDNEFLYLGATAVRIGNCSEKYTPEFHNKDIVIRNNYVYRSGMFYTSNVALFVGPVENLDLSYNTVESASYSAISVGWNWGAHEGGDRINVKNAVISYNYINGFMEGMKDGGAIYVLGGNAAHGTAGYINEIHHNYCVVSEKTGLLADKWTGGWTVLYHDGSSSHWHTHHNTVITMHGSFTYDERRAGKSPTDGMNPTWFSYLSYQSVKGQQAYDNLSEGNCYVGLTEECWIFGGTGQLNAEYDLYSKDDACFADFEALTSARPEYVADMESCGCDIAKVEFPE